MKLNSAEIAGIVNGRITGPPDLPVTEIVTDSRQLSYTEGLIFFAISGKNHDGHLFIDSLYLKGIRVFVIEKENLRILLNIPTHAFIIVKNSVQALQLLAAYKRKAFKSMCHRHYRERRENSRQRMAGRDNWPGLTCCEKSQKL